jgi:uncharacterized repeat protein (TIGR01451 family)
VRRTRVTLRWFGGVALGVVVLLGQDTASSVAASPDVRSDSLLVPSLHGSGFVTGGRNILYTALWTNNGNATLANVLIVVTLPAGSVVLSTDPGMCSISAPADPADPIVVSCPRDNLRSGDTFTQQVFFRAPVVTFQISSGVTSSLKGDEKANDTDRAHTDTFPAPPRQLTILPAAADAAGGCLQAGDATLATQSGLSPANPLITTARLTGPTGQLCTPVTLFEQHRSNPTQFCGAGATCTTDIAMTGAAPVPAPIQLTFTFAASNKNLTWYKTGDGDGAVAEPVPSCLGATQLPSGLGACVNSRAKAGSMSVTLGVLWQGGPDPSWVG